MSHKAFLVIDMQKGSFTPETPRFNANSVITKINKVADFFRSNKQTVLFIQHNGEQFAEFIPGTTEWEILDELEIRSIDTVVEKYANDSFYHSELATILKKRNITELYISGCATDFCVESTIQSALVKDFHVKVLSDSHTTADRPHLKAEKVIEHYNWVWKGMIPTKGSIELLSSDEILFGK